jgi:heme-degrading monooxygenase HmoA
MHEKLFSYIWQYRIRADRRAEFLDAYRPGGAWTTLFSRDASYIDTKLLQDTRDPERYVTIDTWLSQAACRAFRARYADEFEALDMKCEALTEAEQALGDFEQVGGSGIAR